MNFLGRWFSDALSLALSLAGALVLMQAPALSHEYAAALTQVADAQSRDIAAREATARSYYKLESAPGEELMSTLRDREPSNYAGLVQSQAEAEAIGDAVVRIGRSPSLIQPLVAAWDLATVPEAGKEAVAGQAMRSFVPALQLSVAGLVWALAGVVLGSFVAQLLMLPAHRVRRTA